jgi:hypothetical protein
VLDAQSPRDRFADVESVARMLGIDGAGVRALLAEGHIRGVRIASDHAWRVDLVSVEDYLDDQAENERRVALWQQSQTASFPELWGRGNVRHPD